MARLGETDPRWIVAERTDGTNVNNWHWTEKNCMPWAEKTIAALFKDLALLEAEDITLKISEVESVKGEANINTRKGKVFHFYELDIKYKFEGKQGEEKVEGTIHVPELSTEYSPAETEIKVSVSKGKDKDSIRERVKKQGLTKVREQLQNLIDQFKEQKGDLKEAKAKPLSPPPEASSLRERMEIDQQPQTATVTTTTTTTTTTSKPSTETIEFNTHFNAAKRDIWESLLDARRVQAYSQSAANLDPREGGAYSLFNDTVTGEFVKLVPDEKIIQKWRFSHWPKDVSSQVTLTFKDSDDKVELHLKQTGVPSADSQRVQHHWRENVFGRIRVMFGYGGMNW